MNSEPLVCKAKYGSLSMERQGRIVVCRFKGSINHTLLNFFTKNLPTVLGDLQGQQWGYLSSSGEVDAGTPESEKLLVQAGKKVLQLGCVKAAYVLTSAIAIAQTRKARSICGVTEPLEDIIFSSEEDAKRFLQEQLAIILNSDGENS
ncbi:MAG: hypothetical protein ACFHVJ_07040 [Aestuariibacter sp.]